MSQRKPADPAANWMRPVQSAAARGIPNPISRWWKSSPWHFDSASNIENKVDSNWTCHAVPGFAMTCRHFDDCKSHTATHPKESSISSICGWHEFSLLNLLILSFICWLHFRHSPISIHIFPLLASWPHNPSISAITSWQMRQMVIQGRKGHATMSDLKRSNMYKSNTRTASLCFTMSLCCNCTKTRQKKIEKQLNSSLVSIDILPSRTLRLVYWYRCKACVLQLRSLDLCGKKCARTERTERTEPCHQLFDQVPIRPIRCQKKCVWCLWAQLENSILSAEKGKERQR